MGRRSLRELWALDLSIDRISVVLVYNRSYTAPVSGCSYASYALFHILKGGKLGGAMNEIVEAMNVVESCVVDLTVSRLACC
jgi:hypothetical protein